MLVASCDLVPRALCSIPLPVPNVNLNFTLSKMRTGTVEMNYLLYTRAICIFPRCEQCVLHNVFLAIKEVTS